ncbi:hypothetical protein T01_3617, partial [Trichinella spiralis]
MSHDGHSSTQGALPGRWTSGGRSLRVQPCHMTVMNHRTQRSWSLCDFTGCFLARGLLPFLSLVWSIPCSTMARSARSYSRSRSRSSTRSSMSSRRGSYTRPRRRSISRSQTPKRSTHQIVVPSSGLKLQKRPSAVLLDGGEAPSEIICPTCLQSLRSRSRSKSITRKKSLGKKVARKVSVRQRSKSGGKSRRNKKRSVKKSNQKAVLIKASKSRRKRSSLKSIPKQKRYSLRSRAV